MSDLISWKLRWWEVRYYELWGITSSLSMGFFVGRPYNQNLITHYSIYIFFKECIKFLHRIVVQIELLLD
jgi:hypothetical protein